MAKGGRKAAKAPSTTATSPSTATVADVDATPPSNTGSLPPPFTLASTTFLSFTRTLPRNHVFIAHLERTPSSVRRQAFLVPVVLNLLILVGVCWRFYYALPTYLELLITILGYETKWTVDQNARTLSDLLGIVARRTVLLFIDYGIFGLLGRWPWEFVFGNKYNRYTGICGWRWEAGFSEGEEVVVRRGRKWDSSMYVPELQRKAQHKPESTWSKEEELVVYTKCSEALQKSTTEKTALSLLNRDWDVDYRAILDATDLIKEKKFRLADLDHVAFVPWNGKWYTWYPHRSETPGATVEDLSEDTRKLQKFKQQLVDIDCEDVFYRWIEIIQYETSRTLGFTASRKKEAEQELRNMLKTRKQDDRMFFQSVGGTAGIPGLD